MHETTNPYIEIDRTILADAFTSNETRDVLYGLCDSIGPRFAGTDGERLGAEFLAARLRAYGLDKVDIEEFELTAWRRGKPAELRITGAEARSIPCLALPNGAATQTEGVTAALVDIGAGTAEDIERLRPDIRGSIVMTDASGAHRGEIYGRIVEAGGVGFVLRGRTPGMVLPTGCVSFGKAGTIPAVGIAYESGLQIRRLSENGGAGLSIRTFDSFETGTSRNVVAELTGARFPDELVVIGGHMDSHDLAPGAVDNASGTVCVVETARLLALQRGRLERTVRFVAFGAEEVGLIGSYRHVKLHEQDMEAIRFMLNLDCLVMSRPKGLIFHKLQGAAQYVETLRAQMNEPLPLTERIHSHSDHFPFVLKGVPTGEIGGGSFDAGVNSFAHMAGDTPDKVSLIDLREESALAARLLVRAANDAEWPFRTRSPEEVRELLEKTGIDAMMHYEQGRASG